MPFSKSTTMRGTTQTCQASIFEGQLVNPPKTRPFFNQNTGHLGSRYIKKKNFTDTYYFLIVQLIAFCQILAKTKSPREVFGIGYPNQSSIAIPNDQGSEVEMCIGVHETLRTHGSSEANMFRRKGGSW